MKVFLTFWLHIILLTGPINKTVSKSSRKTVRHINFHTTPRVITPIPKYIFIFPEENRKLILTKSDFQNAIYPNVTNINKFPKTKRKESEKDSQHSSSAITEAFKKLATVEDYENIVEENVRTERTFVNFMNDLNDDLKSEEVKFNKELNHDKRNKKKLKSEHRQPAEEDDWDLLGLEGWTGQIAPEKKEKNKA